MNKTEQQIIAYLQDISKGIINITEAHATAIIKLVTKPVTAEAHAKLFKWNATRRSWEFIRVVPTTQEYINEQMRIALNKRVIDQQYMYECYNANAESEGRIYTLNPELF